MTDYRNINRQVMTDTKRQYESIEALKEAINNSIRHQYMVTQEENIDQPIVEHSKTLHVCSGKRSFEAAKAYKGKKTAVLNFARRSHFADAPPCCLAWRPCVNLSTTNIFASIWLVKSVSWVTMT